MRDYVHLHRKILTSWVFEDARRLQLFIYLLAKADEQGMVRLSVNECARRLGIDRKWIERRGRRAGDGTVERERVRTAAGY